MKIDNETLRCNRQTEGEVEQFQDLRKVMILWD